MVNILENLNKAQKEAVVYSNGPLAIIAGAGSGKTRTITHKIAYLIQEKNIRPYRILAVTFTNKAAAEMKERIISLIGEQGQDVKMFTYHALCARILREDIPALGKSKNFNIIDNIDQKQILRPGYKKFDLSSKGLPHNSVIDFISENKNKNLTPEELRKEAKNDTDKALINLYEFYLEENIKTNSLDFDDLLIYVDKLFKAHPEIAKKWANKFDYLLVDEFQDTSLLQYDIIRSLAPHDQITVVGDPNQTIYTWRYADAKLILQFEKNFKNAHVIKLEQNYRSTPQILNAANKLIKKNSNHGYDMNLFTQNSDGDVIEYFHGFSEDAEARWVVDKINELKKSKTQLRDIAILFRANYLSQSLEKALIQQNVNYIIYGGVKFYQREEIKDVISYLKIIANGDEVALKRMINIPARKIGPTSQEALFNYAIEKGEPLYDVIIKYFSTLPISESAKGELGKFINLTRKYKKALETYPVSTILEKFLIEVDYNSVWNTFEDMGRFENIKELIQSIKDWEKSNEGKNVDDYLTEISLYTDREESSKSSDYVSLMTIHTSKGLEFDNVFIFGFSEGIFPSARSMDESGDEGLEEERRLAYVATTRAKKKLFISSSRGFAIDHKTQKKPSRFIAELGINIKDFTREFIAPKDFKDNYESNKDLIVGDKVAHEKFGQGVVVNIGGDIAEIAFKAPHGVKSMMKNHKSIVKVVE